MLSRLTDRDAVLRAVREFDRLGRTAFLEQFGYGEALRYYVRIKGNDYDSKAIVGVAFGMQYPSEGPLRPGQFSGGQATVQRALARLGFDVVDRKAGA
jgi:hypothetical protein